MTQRFFLLCLLVVALAPQPLQAQTWERIHAPARTVWASRGRTVQRAAAAGVREGQLVSSAALTGELRQALIPVSFSDEGLTVGGAELEARFYGAGSSTSYSLTSYFEEVSGGAFRISGQAIGPVTVPKSSAYYTGTRDPDVHGGVADRLDEFLLDVLAQTQGEVDWRAFVDAGENQVPAVVIVTAGSGGHCTGDQEHVWPHRWSLSDLLGAPYRTQSTTATGDTIVIDDYIVQPARECDQSPANIGVLAHETGHLIGLPDLYNVKDFGRTTPVGDWDLMATGNYNQPDSPAHLGAWSRFILGWADVTVADSSSYRTASMIDLPPVADSGSVLLLPSASEEEFLLVELRRRIGADRHLHAEGIVAWYVHGGRLADRRDDNNVNEDLWYPAVAVLSADGRRDMEENINDGDATDPWGWGTDEVLDADAWSARSGEAPWQWQIASFDLASASEPEWARFTLAYAPEPGETGLTVLPETMGPFRTHDAVNIGLSVAGEFVSPLAWTTSGEGLQDLGLTLNSTGRITGTVVATPGEYTVQIRVEGGDGQVGQRTYSIEVKPGLGVSADALLMAVLDPDAVLPAGEAEAADALGNGNGRLDLGDIVLLIRSEIIDPILIPGIGR